MTQHLDECVEWFESVLGQPVAPTALMFSTRQIDSRALNNLVTWLEDAYNVTVEPHELSLSNFDTPLRVAEFIEARVRRCR